MHSCADVSIAAGPSVAAHTTTRSRPEEISLPVLDGLLDLGRGLERPVQHLTDQLRQFGVTGEAEPHKLPARQLGETTL